VIPDVPAGPGETRLYIMITVSDRGTVCNAITCPRLLIMERAPRLSHAATG